MTLKNNDIGLGLFLSLSFRGVMDMGNYVELASIPFLSQLKLVSLVQILCPARCHRNA
jgi:hypothetical protein